MARIVVAGYILRYPLAGNIWAHLQYVLGLTRLGHEVWFIEEAGWEDSCYDPSREIMSSSPVYAIGVLQDLLERFQLANRWAYRDWAGAWHGQPGEAVEEAIATADLFLNVGGVCEFPEMHLARRRAYVDMDPAFTQFRAFGAYASLEEYDKLFTYGANIGRSLCQIPTLGLDWHPLRPPVVLELWDHATAPTPGASWTTIAHWSAYGACEYEGERYGQKDVEFLRIAQLPGHVPYSLEIAVSGPDVPVDLLTSQGWRLADPLAVSANPWRYQEYIQSSRGEFSVAKNAYVKTRSGWFSDRTATYLASGRPAVVQETGLGPDLPTGEGLLVFQTLEDAVVALDAVEAGYHGHCQAARQLAEASLDATKVLTGLLEVCGV